MEKNVVFRKEGTKVLLKNRACRVGPVALYPV